MIEKQDNEQIDSDIDIEQILNNKNDKTRSNDHNKGISNEDVKLGQPVEKP